MPASTTTAPTSRRAGRASRSTSQPNAFPPDRATLRAISETTGGEYFAARSAKALESAYRNLGSRLGRADRPTEVTALFVVAAAVALTAAGALGRLSVPGLP